MSCDVMSVGGSIVGLLLAVVIVGVMLFCIGYLVTQLVKSIKCWNWKDKWADLKLWWDYTGQYFCYALGVVAVVGVGLALLTLLLGWLGCALDLAPWLDKIGMRT